MNLETVIAAYHDVLDAEVARETYAILEAGQRQRRMLVGKQRDRLVCSVLRPRLIVPAQYDTLLRATQAVGRAITTIGDAALRDPALLTSYQLSEAERDLLAIDPGYPGAAVFGRLDAFLAPDGSWCYFVESNLESPAGIAYDEALAEVFSQTPAMQRFRQSYQAEPIPVRQGLQQLLLDTYQRWGGQGTPQVAIVDFRTVVTMSEFEHLRDQFQAAGIPTLIADPEDLSYRGGRLYAFDTPIDLVYRRILQHEFLAAYDRSHPLVQASRDRAVCVINPWRTKPVHAKLVMALISDEDGPAASLIDAETRAAVARYVPWTRLVQAGPTRYQGERVDLLAFASAQRERLVLKPNDEYGGKGVLLGWETSQADWEHALQAATQAPFVLQERVPVPEELYPTWSPEAGLQFSPRYVDSDPLLYADQALGCLTRIAATALLNVSAGGGSAPPTFLVQQR